MAGRKRRQHHQARHAADLRAIVERYHAERAPLGKEAADAPWRRQARGGRGHGRASAGDCRRAYPRWRASFRWLFERHGIEPRNATYPATFDELREIDNGIAGSPQTVRDFVMAEVEATGPNYFVSRLAWRHQPALAGVAALACTVLREVVPAIADASAGAAAQAGG